MIKLLLLLVLFLRELTWDDKIFVFYWISDIFRYVTILSRIDRGRHDITFKRLCNCYHAYYLSELWNTHKGKLLCGTLKFPLTSQSTLTRIAHEKLPYKPRIIRGPQPLKTHPMFNVATLIQNRTRDHCITHTWNNNISARRERVVRVNRKWEKERKKEQK